MVKDVTDRPIGACIFRSPFKAGVALVGTVNGNEIRRRRWTTEHLRAENVMQCDINDHFRLAAERAASTSGKVRVTTAS